MKALFLGSKTLGLNVLRCLYKNEAGLEWKIIHPNDVGDVRSALSSFNEYTRNNNLELSLVSSPSAAKELIFAFKADVAIVCGWYWLLDEQTVSSAPMGFYGIHTSLLPKYRGGSPLIWSIINGDAEVGATVFRLASGMDDGEILHQVRVPNTQEDNVGTILQKIGKGLVETLPAKWHSLLAGSANLAEQDHSQATYCGQRTPEDGRIDWRVSSDKVHNFIRAQTSPYPGAFDYLDGKKIVFLKTQVDRRCYFGRPGQILQRSRENVLISCGGNSALKILEVAVDGVPVGPSKALPSVSIRLG